MKFITMAIHKFGSDDFLTRIDESMLHYLKKINEKGFITTGSQAGRKSIINHMLQKREHLLKGLKKQCLF